MKWRKLLILRAKEWFSFDVRSLALFRITIGCLLLADLINRSSDLEAHYSDSGVLPRSALYQFLNNSWHWSLHSFSGSTFFEGCLFMTSAICATCLILGYRTQLATILSWILLVSLHNRNPLVLQGGDTLLRMLLFWSIFLPLGSYFSLDSKNHPPSRKRILTAGTVALIIQILSVYWISAVQKIHSPDWQYGAAVYYALSIDQFVTPFGQWILQKQGLPEILTQSVLWFEILAPFLLFSPAFFGRFRTATIIAFGILHLGFGLSLRLGLFPWISFVAMLVLLPSSFWNSLCPLRNFHFSKTLPQYLAIRTIPVIFFIGYVLFLNLTRISIALKMPSKLEWLESSLRLDQGWRMFTSPRKEDGWYILSAILKDNTQIDLMKDPKENVISWEKPNSVSIMYRNQRWRKYMMSVWYENHKDLLPFLAKHKVDQWNSTSASEKQIREIEIIFMTQFTDPDQKSEKIEKRILWGRKY
jgi:hypothetical protein